MIPPGVSRGYAGFLFDRFSTWFLGLPPATNYFTIEPVKIPLPDGVSLAADIFHPVLPSNERPVGLLLVQCCYGRGVGMTGLASRPFAARGYTVLFVSTRGTFGSGGIFDPGRNEQKDSQDIVKWMRSQPWYHGSFATLGASYLGQSQYALLVDPPSDCVASVIPVAPHDYARHSWDTGSFRTDRIYWSETVMRQEEQTAATSIMTWLTSIFSGTTGLGHVVGKLPLVDHVEQYFQGGAPWLAKSLRLPDVNDPWWAPARHSKSLDRIQSPTMLVTGYYDPFQVQTFEQFHRLQERGVQVSLVAGPWNHAQAAGLKCMPDIFEFLEEHVAGRRAPSKDRLPVRIFVTGLEQWREMPEWPPTSRPEHLFLSPDATLDFYKPGGDVESSSFTFDPENPTPSVGGNQLFGGGRVNDIGLASRSDVLTYTSALLTDDLEFLGQPVVELAHSSDSPTADLFIRLYEVDAIGKTSRNICERFQALNAEQLASKAVNIKLPDCAHRFKKGSRVRVLISGGWFPMFARNLGAEGNRVEQSTMKKTRHEVRHADGVSRLVLPRTA